MAPHDATGPALIEAARRLLSDFSRCPACAAVLQGQHCPACGVDLTGDDARAVGELSVRAAQVLTEREARIQVLRNRVKVAVAPASAPAPAPHWQAPRPPTPPTPPTPPPTPPTPPTPPSESGPRSGPGVHGLLVGLGALLLSVAAIGFLVFSWRVLSLPGRAAVIAAATVGVLAIASWLRSRLPETAEAVGALGVVLVLGDAWAIRRTGLFNADRPEGLGYAAAAAAVCALLLGGWALISRVRAGSWAAVTLAPLAVLLLAARLDGQLGSVPVFAVGFLLIGLLALGREVLPSPWWAERWLLRAVAVVALAGAGGPAAWGQPGHGRAALVLLAAALVAAAGAPADRVPAGLPRNTSLRLRRAWSLAAGLLAGTAALQAGLALAVALDLDDAAALLVPVLALPLIAVLIAATLRTRDGSGFRRVAFGAGNVVVAALCAVPVVGLAAWLPLRAALVGFAAWTAEPGTRFRDLDPRVAESTAVWAVTLTGLILLVGGGLLALLISGWPVWLRRPVRVTVALAAGLAVLVLPLVPAAPVVAVVAGLLVLSVLAAVLAVRASTEPDRYRTSEIAAWAAGGLTGTLAVVLAWSARDLSLPLTALGVAGLLLARRRLPITVGGAGPLDQAEAAASAALAALAGTGAAFAVGAGAGVLGASASLRLVWAGLAGGLAVAALIGLPRWLPPARTDRGQKQRAEQEAGRDPGRLQPGRAGWTGVDRLAAAVPGLIALVLGLLATLPGNSVLQIEDAAWPRPVLLAVALLIGLTGAAAVRPAVARALPALAPACALAVTPLLGALVTATRDAIASPASSGPGLALLWAAVAATGALVAAGVTLTGRIDPVRRLAAEFGVLVTGLIALALVDGLDALWPVLLVLGAAAAAIATTPDRQPVGWLAGLLLTGSTWTRLAVGHVTLVEAYSLPPAAALLALAGYRFYRDRATGSPSTDPARALLPVATVGLAPSIIAAATGSPVRPAVLIAVAAVMVLAGWVGQRRDQMPLGAGLVGVGVLTAGGTAVIRAGTALWNHTGSAQVSLFNVEVWTLPTALVLLFAGLARVVEPPRETSSTTSAAGGRIPPTWPAPPAAPPLLVALLLAGLPTLVAALMAVDRVSGLAVPRVVAVLAAAALAALAAPMVRVRWGQAAIGLEPVATGLAVLAAATGGVALGAGPIEAWTGPLAVLLLIQGWVHFERLAAGGERPGGLPASWAAYAPGVVMLLLPSLYLDLVTTHDTARRGLLLILAAAAVLVAGAIQRLQAPVLLGAGVLAVQAVVLLAPVIAELPGVIPLWGWLAAVGLGLILLGARYEARMRQLKMIRLRLAALR